MKSDLNSFTIAGNPGAGAPGPAPRAKRKKAHRIPAERTQKEVSMPEDVEPPIDLGKWNEQMAARASALSTGAEPPFDSLESASLQALRLRFVELVTDPTPDFGQIKIVFSLLLEARSHQLAERKLNLATREMEEEHKPRLSEEELRTRLQTLFGWVEAGTPSGGTS